MLYSVIIWTHRQKFGLFTIPTIEQRGYYYDGVEFILIIGISYLFVPIYIKFFYYWNTIEKAYVVCVDTACIHNNDYAFHILKNPSLPNERITLTGLFPIIKFLYIICVIPFWCADFL